MAIIYIEKNAYEVNESSNLLQICLSLGFDIPYFCWHPALGSVGACRQCAIKKYRNVNDTQGQLVMACMTPVTNNMFISIVDNEASNFRKNIIECLMINHPHDCPVCEEGGHCHLQDMTVMVGQAFRRYRFNKRTHYNQYLGPFISHEMNRCISCYRCVRYYKDYADGKDLGVYGIHDNIYFGRQKEGVLESEFSGNLIEICPTGVFTDKTHSKRYNRKWDMQFAPSICQQCSIGCNISPGERYGELRRIENRYNGSINHYFLCDRGRFGYGYINLKNRPRQPLKQYNNNWFTLTVDKALNNSVKILHDANKTIGIGSPRASIESNFALRELVGIENFYTGITSKEQDGLMLMLNILRNGGIRTPSLRDIENYDAILVLGEDLTQTGARIALAIRQAVKGKARKIAESQKIADWQITSVMNIGQNAKNPLFITNVDRTGLDDIATWSYYAPVDNQARLGFAIAHALDKEAPIVTNFDDSLRFKINIIVQALVSASMPLIISGSSSGNQAIISAAFNIAHALKKLGSNVGISFVATAVNSMGLAMIGGKNLDEALDLLNSGKADNAIILENDLYNQVPSIYLNSALKNINKLILIDHQYTALQEKANIVLSAASFVESSGTVINQEGRAQRFFKVYDPTYYDKKVIMMESWRWLHFLHSKYLNKKISWTRLDHIIDAISIKLPQLAGIKQAAPNAEFRVNGQKLARQPHRYSGRTAVCTNINVHEPRVPQDKDTMFNFSMEGSNDILSQNNQIAFIWSPGWNSPQAWNKFQDKLNDQLFQDNHGVRLLEPNNNQLNYFNGIPSNFQHSSTNSWIIVSYWHLFGSDETSQRSSIIQERMLPTYVVISQEDAIRLNIKNGTSLIFTCANINFFLPARISFFLTPGQLGLPIGFPGVPIAIIGQKAKDLRKA